MKLPLALLLVLLCATSAASAVTDEQIEGISEEQRCVVVNTANGKVMVCAKYA